MNQFVRNFVEIPWGKMSFRMHGNSYKAPLFICLKQPHFFQFMAASEVISTDTCTHTASRLFMHHIKTQPGTAFQSSCSNVGKDPAALIVPKGRFVFIFSVYSRASFKGLTQTELFSYITKQQTKGIGFQKISCKRKGREVSLFPCQHVSLVNCSLQSILTAYFLH